MGWGSGSQLMSDIILELKDELEFNTRKRVYQKLISSFSDMDCDTLAECMYVDGAYDEAFKEDYIETYGLEDWNECFEDTE